MKPSPIENLPQHNRTLPVLTQSPRRTVYTRCYLQISPEIVQQLALPPANEYYDIYPLPNEGIQQRKVIQYQYLPDRYR